MSKRALITGGAGFIGYHLARHLADNSYNVTLLDNFARSEADEELDNLLKEYNVTFIKGDITKSETFNSIDKEFDYIYHFTAINGTENFYKIPDKVLKVGVFGIMNILDWFVKQNKGKLMFASSSEAYAGTLKLVGDTFPIPTPEEVPLVIDDPKNVRWSYGAGKIVGEVAVHSYAKAYNLKNFVIIRYHNIYGSRMGFDHVLPQFIGRIVKKENPFKIFGGQETRTFCHVDDAVRATRLVMESEKSNGQTVHIGRSDGEIKIIDLAKQLFEAINVSPHPQIDIQPAPAGSVLRRCPDTSKLQALGFIPKISLQEGLRQTYEWYKDKFN